ncbi:MAG: hypothetical protein GXO10_02935 [Crenarchaeota archaeon]|nr:hypothetical protein [Thermoproteota archaeon]
MALRKPLVLVDGILSQLPAGDTLDATITDEAVISMTNGSAATTFLTGQPVYISGADLVNLGIANSLATSEIIGLCYQDIPPGISGNILARGYLTLSDWTNIIGTAALVPGTVYYLDPDTAGMLTSTPPVKSKYYLVRIGRALNTTTLEVVPRAPIAL